MKVHRRVVAVATSGFVIALLFLWVQSWTTFPPLAIEVKQDGPPMLHEMATVSLVVSNRTSRALRCWVVGVQAKNRSQQLLVESGLGLLPFGAPDTNLQCKASGILCVPVPLGCRGEFRIQVGYGGIREGPMSRLINQLVRLPVVGRWLSMSRTGYRVLPTEWMAVPNKAGAGNGAGSLSFHVGRLRRAVPDLARY
jgi:hypothetical protein